MKFKCENCGSERLCEVVKGVTLYSVIEDASPMDEMEDCVECSYEPDPDWSSDGDIAGYICFNCGVEVAGSEEEFAQMLRDGKFS